MLGSKNKNISRGFDRDLLTEIKSRINLRDIAVDLGSQRRQSGWLCPFHDDHSPSLSIRDRGYRCFACGATGDVFRLIMSLQNPGFRDAVGMAAQFAGIEVPDPPAGGRGPLPSAPLRAHAPAPKEAEPVSDLRREILTWVARRARLRESVPYLTARGISHETAVAAGVGIRSSEYQEAADSLRHRC